jgi:hypothetical protein
MKITYVPHVEGEGDGLLIQDATVLLRGGCFQSVYIEGEGHRSPMAVAVRIFGDDPDAAEVIDLWTLKQEVQDGLPERTVAQYLEAATARSCGCTQRDNAAEVA